MDLRKAVLSKQPFQEINNLSVASDYESALEDSEDSSMYFSFSNNTLKADELKTEANNTSLITTDDEGDDKENRTIIIRHSSGKSDINEKTFNFIPENTETGAQGVLTVTEQDEDDEAGLEPMEIPLLTVEDPNENVINPFTTTDATMHAPVVIPEVEFFATKKTLNFVVPIAPQILESKPKMPENKVTRRTIYHSKIPSQAHSMYSPVLRKSLERKVKTTSQLSRRTVCLQVKKPEPVKNTEMMKPAQKPQLLKPGTSSIPKLAIKSTIYRCTVDGCKKEFKVFKLFQDHEKAHIVPTSSTNSFPCSYCKKILEKELALENHQLNHCTKIPVTKKRQLMDKIQNQQRDKRRTTVFNIIKPKKSPARKSIAQKTPGSFVRSGILVTPRKVLTCTTCNQKFIDVLSFANHVVAHNDSPANDTE